MSIVAKQASAPAKKIRLNAFAANGPVHLSPGFWTHPEDRSLEYKTIDHWLDLARLLERGKFDALFLADGNGVNDVYGGSADTAIRLGAQIPRGDPFVVVPAMAAVTRHLGFGVTGNVSYEPCVPFARRLTTLDHITGGRIAWNIVTGFLASAAKAQGQAKVTAHDTRYDIADEYMEVMYKLWEGSWQDDAVIADRATGQFAAPERVHKIKHDGEHFHVEAIFMSEPSPQRTPLLFQAGASTRGRAFAGRHAECVFVSGPSRQVIAPIVADTRRKAAEQGRDPHDIRFFSLATVIVAPTQAEASAKFDEYTRYINQEAALAMFSSWTGTDFSSHDLGAPIPYVVRDAAMNSAIESFTIADPDRVWTLREMMMHNAIGGRGPVFVGDPISVADALQSWVADTNVDGFNLSYALMPNDFRDFIDLVVPELQSRGVYKRHYAAGPLREKLFGPGRARVLDTHPASIFRA
ncbi:LLM class flavin-dependent oxidoreductase [Bosea sp. RCC_152_1]|uniref:LLM class flavin-dependent oxidoreductase n=1 Tax=Bosea sp. RCC_152_1 TaxID=3239228 RepID=UPI003524539A